MIAHRLPDRSSRSEQSFVNTDVKTIIVLHDTITFLYSFSGQSFRYVRR